tara:strand:+ start:7122 stop:7973 length:852 start_codon:yes stop_codon:yes gene_type:complete
MELLKSDSDHYYFTEGQGDPIVFLHGFPDCPENYKDQLSFFASKGYEAIVPYMPGYHPEDKELDTYQSVRIAENMIEFIESVTEKKIFLFGHDWGSSVSYAVAGLRPDLVTKLISVSVPHGLSVGTSFLSDAEQQRKSWYMFFFQLEIAEAAVSFNNLSFIDRLWSDWSPNWPEYKEYAKNTIDVLSKESVLSKALAYYRCTFQSGLQSERINELGNNLLTKKISVPSMYLHGENDGCIGHYLSEDMENFFEDLEVKILPDCGHFLHLEKKDLVNNLVLDFID